MMQIGSSFTHFAYCWAGFISIFTTKNFTTMKRIAKYFLFLLPLLLACQDPVSGYYPPAPSKDKKPDSGTVTPEPEKQQDPPVEILPAVPPQGYIVVGYATYWDTTMPDPTLLTHIVYSFAHINKDFESLDIKNTSRLTKIRNLKTKYPNLKVQLSVGGWGAGNFSEMAADEKHRKIFCQNCAAAVKDYNLDGIDLDWEYPTSNDAGISCSPDDTKNFTLLLRDLRIALGNDKLITMASADNAKYVNFKEAIGYLNFVNVMTYDMGKPPYHNAGLYHSTMTELSCEESVALHYKAGVPYEKIVLGIPFFGRADGKAFGGEDEVDYKDINPGKYAVRWDDMAKVPYLVDEKGNMVLTYDDEVSVGLKADYIKQKNLLGAMYWNIEADDNSWTLSKAIASRLLPGSVPETDAVLVTNPYVQTYMEEVSYKDRDFSSTLITKYPGGGPGEADIPPSITLSWKASADAGALRLRLWDSEWSREYNLAAGTQSLSVSNLVPGSQYTYLVSASNGNVIAKGSFRTRGALHQLYFDNKVRNARDLGGWKTTDGKTLRFRKLYRGGRVDKKYMNDAGREEALAEGIRAELDLREAEDVPKSSAFGNSARFCAPGFDTGYRTMLRDRAAGIKECFEFVVSCLREGRPVYFHCAAGRDRTGTMAMVLLGVLGVREGDIAKDYELTYFSPEEWSMEKGEYQHVRTAGSYQRAVEYLWEVGASGDFRQRVENYLLGIGVKQQDIDDLRTIMLQ